jgi:dUTP pyrophosphatase
MSKLVVRVKRLNEEAKLPKKALPGDAGYDVFTNEQVALQPGERKLIGTGIKIAVPQGYEAQVRPKSGLAINYGITVLNTPGTIDPNYRGELKVILINLSDKEVKIEKGQKIAQIIFNKVETPEIIEVDELDETERNEKGFGSTGLH